MIMADIKDGGALERLKDFFTEQVERKIERDMMMGEAQAALYKEMAPTKAQVAWGVSQLAPGGAWLDSSGNMVAPPSGDVRGGRKNRESCPVSAQVG